MNGRAKLVQALFLTLAGLLALGGLVAVGWPTTRPDPPSGVLAVLEGQGGQPDLLSHGDDRLPPRPASLTPEASGVSWPCEGDGTDGKRVQWIYGHSGDDTTESVRPTIEQLARQVEGIFAASSNGQLVARYVTAPDCSLDVLGFRFSGDGVQTFDGTINELRAAGHNRADRKYLTIMQGGSYCGIGTVTDDDQPWPGNSANSGPSYARVDQLCRNARVAAHELVHNLGGVQLSAPHSTGGWHCSDGLDVMCYADGAANSTQRVLCPSDTDRERLDCRADDYFATAPAGGSYLDTHWNVARSGYLGSATSPTSAPPTTVPPTTSTSSTTTTTGKGKTETDLTLPSTLRVNQDVRVTVAVDGSCEPSGVVEIRVSGQVVSRQVLDAGKATATLRFTRPGRFTVRATYLPAGDCAGSTDSARPRVTGS